MVQELENGHEGTLRGHSPAPGRPIGTPERLDRGVPAWRDQDLSHGVESLDSNFTRVEPRGTKGVRTSSRSPNRTQG